MTQQWHEQAKGTKEFISSDNFSFVAGGTITELRLAYEMHGQLNSDKSNVILIAHALSTHSHVCSHASNTQPGWWEKMVGPGCPIDTQKYAVICINNLGSCFGSSGPSSVRPEINQRYGMSFPRVAIADMVHAQRLLLDALGITQLCAVIGPSMGGMLALAWSILYPDSVQRLISISSSLRSYPTNIALRTIQRQMVQLDPLWQQGNYAADDFLPGFYWGRQLGHLTYRNPVELDQRFADLPADSERGIKGYLAYNAKQFIQKFDANSFLYLSQAMDDFDVGQFASDRQAALEKIRAKTLVIAVSSDHLFPVWQQQALQQALVAAKVDTLFHLYDSSAGHDAFLVETKGMGTLISDFLQVA